MRIRSLKTTVISLVALVVLAIPAIAVSPVAAQIDDTTRTAACEGIGAAGGDCFDDTANTSINSIVENVINILSWIVGIAAVIMIIIGGFRYITSGGDSNSIAAAKNTILYAIIGLVVAAMAQILVQFVLNEI